MKKEKVLALLLTAAMSVTAAAPVAAADFTDETDTAVVFDAEETQTAEADGENSFAEASQETEAADDEISFADETDEADVEIADAETEPEILTDDASDDYEDGEISVQAAEDEENVFSDGEDAQIATQAASASDIRGTITLKNNRAVVSGTYGNSNDAYYRFTPQTAGMLTITTSTTSTEGYNIFVKPVIAVEETSEEIDGCGVVLHYNPWVNTFPMSKGTTYLIGGRGFNCTNYKMALEFKPVKESFPENYYDQVENWYDAREISLNRMYYGILGLGGDKDYYKFTVPATGKYTIITNGRFAMTMYNESGEKLADYYIYGYDRQEKELKKGTTFYFGYSGDASEYTFSVNSHQHSWKTSSVTKATPNQNGRLVRKCSDCGETTTSTIYRPTSVKLSATTYTYNGNAKRPSVTVTDAKGKTISRSYYNVSYDRDSKSAGRHTVRVTFKGNYSGTLSRSYTINPQATYITRLSRLPKGFAVNLRRLSSATATGYQVQYSLNRNFKGAKVKVLRGTSMNIRGLQGNKNYYVRIRAYKGSGGRAYYSAWSGVKIVRTRR